MRHRLVTGAEGWKWAPFAEARIKAMQATGLAFAAQHYVMPDGALVDVSIQPGVEHIRIDATGGSVYMDTGDLKIEYPAELSPSRRDPSKLNFIDIALGSKYLGEIRLKDSEFGQQTANQTKNRPMTQLMESLAIGWKKPADWDALTAQKQIEWLEAKKAALESKTIMKKFVVGSFPASLWTGKMRLFMQAQYGMPLESDLFRFTIDLVGTEVVLKYAQPDVLQAWQPGLWTHKSPGVYTADDGKYYILDIASGDALHPGFVVYSYEIKHSGSAAKPLLAKIKTTLDPDVRSQIEAYLFSISYIDLSTMKMIGSYDPAPRKGGGISYGWKFNTKGDKSSVVMVAVAGDAEAHTLHYESTTVHLTFGYTPATDTEPYKFTVSGEKIIHDDWVDGWGTYNIFVPQSVNASAPSVQFSVAVTWAALNIPSFTDVPIYGCYLNDVWTPATITKFPDFSGLSHTNSFSGIYFNPGDATDGNSAWQYGFTYADESFTYTDEWITSSTAMNISIGSLNFVGKMKTGTRYTLNWQAGGANTKTGLYMNFAAGQIGGTAAACFRPPIWSGAPVPPDIFPPHGLFVGTYQGIYVKDTWTYSFTDYNQWTFIVPALDAEAMYLPTIDRTTPSSVTHENLVTGLTTMKEYAVTIGGIEYELRPNMPCAVPGWFGDIGPAPTVTTDAVPPPKPPVITVYVCNRADSLFVGSPQPGFSYEPVFTVDRSYPYIAKGFTMNSSYNKRYTGSDAGPPTSGLAGDARFIGWA